MFYSADLQAHGREARLFDDFVQRPPADVDVLLMEGTHLRRDAEPATGRTEREVEDELVTTFKQTPGMVLAMYSAQNIDRLVTMFRACKKSGRHLVVDLYGASVAEATGNENIPRVGFDRLLVYVPDRQRVQVKKAREFHRTNDIRPVRIFPEELAARAHELVLTFRTSMIREVEQAACLKDARAVWSMWPGYLTRPGQERLLRAPPRLRPRLGDGPAALRARTERAPGGADPFVRAGAVQRVLRSGGAAGGWGVVGGLGGVG